MTITVQIIADSISPAGKRITTFQLRYPRFIHAELMTHRVFSRNASSSRAIPVKKMIEDLRRDPAMPIYWGRAQPGMQAGEDWHAPVFVEGINPFDMLDRRHDPMTREQIWLAAMEQMIKVAEGYARADYHKQIVNRLLEPWAHINVVVTATSYENFFTLRCHPDAQPEIQQLAVLMREEMRLNIPDELQPGDWHLPYIRHEDHEAAMLYGNTADGSWLEVLKKVSVARCARVSYLTHDGRPTTVEEDLALAEKLIVATPLHASPAEHQATPDTTQADTWTEFDNPELHGNLDGWIQYRKTLPNEHTPG